MFRMQKELQVLLLLMYVVGDADIRFSLAKFTDQCDCDLTPEREEIEILDYPIKDHLSELSRNRKYDGSP